MDVSVQRRGFIAGLLAVPAFASPIPAFAHREKLTTTELRWNNSRQSLDITHNFHIHHAESALAKMGILPQGNLLDIRNQARLAVYVEDSFSLNSAQGDKLNVQTIGAESDGSVVYVFQQCLMDVPPSELRVSCSFLRPQITEQINEVHLNINNRISSMRLSGRQTQKLLIAK